MSILTIFLITFFNSLSLYGQEVTATWLFGSNSANPSAVYGEKGVPAASNIPGPRSAAISWTAPNGYFYVFGGSRYSYSQGSEFGFMNDLWRWDGLNWTWISGTNETNLRGNYGIKGVVSSINMPGARSKGVSWVTSNGDVYIFGGQGYDSQGRIGMLNDLWKWDGENWTWVSGTNLRSQNGIAEEKGVADSQNMPGSRRFAVSWLGSNDELYLFSGAGFDLEDRGGWLNDLWKWDGGNWTWMSGSRNVNENGTYGVKGVPSPNNVPGTRLSALGWVDNDGNAFVFGGYGRGATGGPDRLHDLWKWDGSNWTWIHGPNIAGRAFYGEKGVTSSANLPEGRSQSAASFDPNTGNAYIFGGLNDSRDRMNDLWKWDGENWTWINGDKSIEQRGTYGTKEVPDEANVPGARWLPATFTGVDGAFYLFGGTGNDGNVSEGDLNDFWRISEPKNSQSIAFDELSQKKYGDDPFEIEAMVSSGLTPFFTSSDKSVATVSGNTITILKSGITVITVSQPGTAEYYGAKSAAQVLTVNKATLTATADDKSKDYGAANPDFSITYSGFVNGEDETVLDTAPSASTSAALTSDVGVYSISLSDGLDSNYRIEGTSGILTVIKITLVITADDLIREIREDNPGFTFTYTGFVNGETETILDEAPVAITTAETASPTGSYAISLSGGNDNNYDLNLEAGILTVIGPEVSFPTRIDFEATGRDLTSTMVLIIDNIGDGPMRINEITLPEGFSIDESSLVIDSGTSHELIITFQPIEVEVYEGEMSIVSNAGNDIINLSGEGMLVTSLEEEVSAKQVKVFPNPAGSSFSIDLSALTVKKHSVSMVDARGGVLFSKSLGEGEILIKVDMAGQKNGLYLVHIKTAKGTVTKKLLINR